MPRDRSTAPSRPQNRAKPTKPAAALSSWAFARIVVLAGAAVVASGWALVRFYTRVHPPMIVPVAPAAAPGARDAGAAGTELIPAPEIEVEGK